jgi:hypothetical protein
LQTTPGLDYADGRVRSAPGTGSAIASFCLGLLVFVEGIWALVVIGGRDRHDDTDAWMILGSLLLMGAIAAAIGLACAVYGRVIRAPANRLRQVGGILSAVYLVAYAVLLGVVAIWR